MKTGAELRDDGMELALFNNPTFKEKFFLAADTALAKDGTVTAEEVIRRCGLPDGSRNAIGAAMRSFALSRGLEIVGYAKGLRPSRHAGRSAIWAPKINQTK